MSANRFEVTKEIYLGNSELNSKNHSKKATPKSLVDSAVLKPKRHNTFNTKEPTRSNNSAHTMVLKQKAGSISHLMNGNESTLPLSGQGDSPGRLNDIKSIENYTNDKRHSLGSVNWTSEKHERNISFGSGINGSDGNAPDIENQNAKMRAEIARMTVLITKERNAMVESADKDKEILDLRYKIKKFTLDLETLKNMNSKPSKALPEVINKIQGSEESRTVVASLTGRKMKVFHPFKKTLKMEFNIADPNTELESFRNKAIKISLPFSAKSSARGIPIKEADTISSARNFERAISGGRGSPSKFLIRKLSDQGNDYFSNQTFNSSRENQSNEEKMGLKDTKERLYKISRIVGGKKCENSPKRRSELPAQFDDLGLAAVKSDMKAAKKAEDPIPQLLFSLYQRVDKVFKGYHATERDMAARNEKLLKVLDQKLKERESKKIQS